MTVSETPLGRHLKRLIQTAGPLRVDRFMAEALMHPEHGYYARGDRIGAAGDFITAPEITQMFGELIGLWLADRWHSMGQPAPVRLVELGPGRGTLMTDILRSTRVMPGFAEAIDLHLVESNASFRAAQAEAGLPATWHDDLGSVPDGPLLLVANEFFDALPVRQLVYTGEQWSERAVGLDQHTGALVFTVHPLEDADAPKDRTPADTGAIVERCPAGEALAAAIAGRLSSQGGAALIVDYGYRGPALGETLQAVRAHQQADPLAAPGQADLTAHVDFTALADAARAAGAEAHGPVGQGAFLDRLGLGARAAALKQRAGPTQAGEIDRAVARLVAPDQMGTLFKALALTPAQMPPPPGFDTEPS